MDAWMKEIEVKDIPSDYHQVAELIGIESLIVLSNTFGGTRFYIPKPETLIQVARNKRIATEFDGGNFKELARKYNLSEDWVRVIVKQSLKKPNTKAIR